MLWQFIPLVPQIVVFILTLLCIIAGQPKSGELSDFHILSVDATGLEAINGTEQSKQLPIHDYYKLYLTTQCSSNYNKSSNSYVDVACSKPSNNTNFDLKQLISNDLENNHENLNSTKPDLGALFPKDLQLDFELHNLRFHVAYVFYILTAVWCGILLAIGFLTFTPIGQGFAILAAMFSALFIASVIATAVANEAAQSIERNSDYLTARVGGKFLALTWSAFAIFAVLNTASYVVAGLVAGIEEDD